MINGRSASGRGYKIRASLILLGLFFLATMARADSRVRLQNIEVSQQLEKDFQKFVGESFEKEFNHNTSSEFLKRMNQAVALSHSSAAVDYASDFQFLSFSLGSGLGYQEGYARLDEVVSGEKSPDGLSGLSAQVGMTLGLHFYEPHRSRYFLSFSQVNFSENDLKVTGTGIGVLWQYKLLGKKDWASPFVEFRGLHIATGLRYADFKSHYKAGLVGLDLNGNSISPEIKDYSLVANASLDARTDVSLFTVPVEISAAINFFRSISFYSLFGIDFNSGHSEAQLIVESPIQIVNKKDGEKLASADATMLSLQSAKPDLINYRGLLGMQFELGHGAVFFQYQKSFDLNAYAAALGFRAYY